MLKVASQPFGVATTPGGTFAFAGLTGAVGVFSVAGDRLHLRRSIAIPGEARGVALTPNGRYLVVADGDGGVYVLGVEAAEQGSSPALVGQLTSTGIGAIEASVSPDGTFVFVTLEYSNEVAVFNLRQALASGFSDNTPVGMVPVGRAPVGLATSSNGRYLYVTSEVAPPSTQGSLSTVDIAKAETDPSGAVVSSIPAGCSPVRVVVGGASVYVAARGSNSVLWLSSRDLTNAPRHSLRASVRVGSEPVGLAVVDGGREILVADSNRFGTGPEAGLALLRLAPDGRPELRGYMAAGQFPRDIASARSGHLALIANYGSSQLETLSFPLRTKSRRALFSLRLSILASAVRRSVGVDRPDRTRPMRWSGPSASSTSRLCWPGSPVSC